ncbi:MAG: hypothetical protein PHC68_14765 [Syntrophorhabdaceae bacterium]|nr:hypothetical protein [Syntrophorhabdaceae bacterium]
MFRRILSLIVLLFLSSTCSAVQFPREIEIGGSILDRDGNLFTDEVVIEVELETVTYPDVVISNLLKEITSETKILEKRIYGGTFTWKLPAATFCKIIKVSKEGYYDDYRYNFSPNKDDKIIVKDLILHLIKKGTPTKLEYTNGAEIPEITDKKSSGKQCGWSFSKRWYFPVDGDVPVDIVLSVNENNKRTYTMKEPGGFIYCPGLPTYGSRPDELYNRFEWMTEAPEDGYVQTICPAEKTDKEQEDIYYYFKTPDGKYGKIAFRGYIDYYINPDGSRNLEVEKFWYRSPLNPGIEHMPDDNEAYSPDE